MKISIEELRDMIAAAVGRTLTEAKKGAKIKEIPEKSEESILQQKDRHIRGLKGYSHSKQNDFSEPLGDENIVKRQGRSNMGNWTGESVARKIKEMQLRKFIRIIVNEEVARINARK